MKQMKDVLKGTPNHQTCDFGITHFNLTKRSKEFVDDVNKIIEASRPPKTDTTAPTVPSQLNVTSTNTTLKLSWKASRDSVGVSGYKVNIDGGSFTTTTSLFYTFTSLSVGTSHTLSVKAFDAAGNESAAATIVGTTLGATTTTTSTSTTTTAAPTTTTTTTAGTSTTTTTTAADTQSPTAPSITSVLATDTTLKVTWSASSDNVSVEGYTVSIPGVGSANTTSTNYTFTGLTEGTTYTINVYAYDTSHNTSDTATTTATTLTITSSPTAAVIYCNFEGETVSGTPWNNGGTIVAKSSGLTIDQKEYVLANMRADYAAYDVLITDDLSAYQAANPFRRTRIIFTETSEWYGSAGGTAFIGSMFWGDNTPCWVFTALLSYNHRYIWTAGSHEAGHTIGLRHQSVYDGNCIKTSEYNYGPVSVGGQNIYAPTMGSAYSRPPTWWTGPSSVCCTCTQDDEAMLTNALGLKP